MSLFTRVFLIGIILLLAATDVLLYWNQHLYYEAENLGEADRRIAILERAGRIYPLNELVFYELGKAYNELGMNSLGEEERSRIHLQKSLDQLNRSLQINPPFYFGHYYLARTLHDLSFYTSSSEERAHQEFKKAAYLAGENTQVFFEVGRVFLSQWQSLSQKDREFTLGMLKKVFEGKDRERIHSLFYVWEMNVGDFAVMDQILPEDAQTYADFAEFLGERSLSLEQRRKYLARAESLEFRRAQDVFEAGEHARFYYRFKDARTYYNSCRNILKKIHFYQELSTSPTLIDPMEFEELQKQVLLNLGKTYLEQGEEFEAAAVYLWDYLGKEESAEAVGELESFLESKGFFDENTDTISDDLDRFSLLLYLSFKQGRFRENMRGGRDLLRSFSVVPEEQTDRLVKVLGIVGESFQKMDHIYDSNDFFQRALERNPDNLEVLLKLRRNYERLNAVEDIRKTDRSIDRIVSPREIELNLPIQKGKSYRRDMVLEGRKINLGIHIGSNGEAITPLITILFNGRAVWEDFVGDGVISIPVESKAGKNLIQVVPLNRGVELERITYEQSEEPNRMGAGRNRR